ncbi:MAG TPA: cytochrome ubiquinol oxidase subunit I [Candidatus Baltobacteraceae bacterium]|jgi:cytochrome d ubiquinol oxidase subunit I|nr:cytochrome ubiquinol oxidase subunit I [Candidatus Baltobacteraceae bacterium]
MDHLLAARAQMGTSLEFHFVFSALGVGMPLFMLLIEALWLKTGDRDYYLLARTWSKAMAALFAVGAVSGTVISFELGLLWPQFMRYAGGIIGTPFSMEGFAFFIEAVFVGIYLYGWERLSPRAHWLCGIPVAISGAASAFFVMTANAWMNTPAGFRLAGGRVVDVDPIAAMFNPAWRTEVLHTMLACYTFTAFLLASIYALKTLRNGPAAAAKALRVAMIAALIFAPAQVLAGDMSARFDAHAEPEKLAAMEGQFKTESGAPLRIGGIPDRAAHVTRFALEIPGGLSFLATGNPRAVIRGLDDFPQNRIPNAALVHPFFQLMVGLGTAMVLVAIWWLFATWIRHDVRSRALLWAIVVMGPAALVAMEAGWMVTEEGRQPWVARGYFLVSQSVTPSRGVNVTFVAFTVLYVLLALTLLWLLRRIDRTSEEACAHAA